MKEAVIAYTESGKEARYRYEKSRPRRILLNAQLVPLPALFRWYLFRNVTGRVPGPACPNPGQYEEELRMLVRLLLRGVYRLIYRPTHICARNCIT